MGLDVNASSIYLKDGGPDSPGCLPSTTLRPLEAQRKYFNGGSSTMQRNSRGTDKKGTRSQRDRAGRAEGPWGAGVGRPAHQLHAQAVLLPAVVAGDLLLDLLQCGRALRLLCRFTDILEQTQRGGGCTMVLRTRRGMTTPPQRPWSEMSSSSAQRPRTAGRIFLDLEQLSSAAKVSTADARRKVSVLSACDCG